MSEGRISAQKRKTRNLSTEGRRWRSWRRRSGSPFSCWRIFSSMCCVSKSCSGKEEELLRGYFCFFQLAVGGVWRHLESPHWEKWCHIRWGHQFAFVWKTTYMDVNLIAIVIRHGFQSWRKKKKIIIDGYKIASELLLFCLNLWIAFLRGS